MQLETEIYRLKGKSYRELADELDSSKSALARHVELGEAIQAIPELADFKSEDDAWKAWKAFEEKLVVDELIKRSNLDMGEDDSIITALEDSFVEEGADDNVDVPLGKWSKAARAGYVLGDALEGMDSLDRTYEFDFAEVDPPYGIDLKTLKRKEGERHGTIESYTEVNREDYGDWLDDAAGTVHAMLRDDSWCVWWYALEHYGLVIETLRRRGFTVNPVPAIWAKTHGQTKQPNYNLASCFEPFLVARKGKPVLQKPGRSNIFSFDPILGSKKIHATERPIKLIQEILDTFTLPGSQVLVPFLGSGTTLRACYTRGLKGVGWDLDTTIRNKFLLQVREEEEAGAYDGVDPNKD